MAIHLPGKIHGALCAVQHYRALVHVANQAKHSGQSLPVSRNVHAYSTN